MWGHVLHTGRCVLVRSSAPIRQVALGVSRFGFEGRSRPPLQPSSQHKGLAHHLLLNIGLNTSPMPRAPSCPSFLTRCPPLPRANAGVGLVLLAVASEKGRSKLTRNTCRIA